MAKRDKELFFSVELKSKSDVKSMSIPKRPHENVLVEGSMGELVQLGFTEGIVFEIVGERGVLRVDISEEEITQALIHERIKNRRCLKKKDRNNARGGGETK